MSGHIPLLVRWLTRIGVIPRAAVAQLDLQTAPAAQSVLDAGRLAEKTYLTLDHLPDEIVLIARMGQNLAQYGLTYSHLGFAIRGLRRGEWAVIHLLNTGDGARSHIFEEGMVNFYSDNPYQFASCILTLPLGIQAALKAAVITSGKAMHCPFYSLTSYPWQLSTQNSNQWVLEVLASVLAKLETPSRDAAQAWLKEQGYCPSVLPIGLATQWAGPLLRDSIRFEDQPEETRRAGQIETVTVDSVLNWLAGPQSPFKDNYAQCRQIHLSL